MARYAGGCTVRGKIRATSVTRKRPPSDNTCLRPSGHLVTANLHSCALAVSWQVSARRLEPLCIPDLATGAATPVTRRCHDLTGRRDVAGLAGRAHFRRPGFVVVVRPIAELISHVTVSCTSPGFLLLLSVVQDVRDGAAGAPGSCSAGEHDDERRADQEHADDCRDSERGKHTGTSTLQLIAANGFDEPGCQQGRQEVSGKLNPR